MCPQQAWFILADSERRSANAFSSGQDQCDGNPGAGGGRPFWVGRVHLDFPGQERSVAHALVGGREAPWFQGTPEPAAIAEISLYAREVDPAAAGRMTAAVTALLSRTLGVPAGRIYVKYDSTPLWGWNGNNF